MGFTKRTPYASRFSYDDPWLASFIQTFQKAVDLAGAGFISDFIPALTFLDRKKLQGFRDITESFNALLSKEYKEHREVFDFSEKIRRCFFLDECRRTNIRKHARFSQAYCDSVAQLLYLLITEDTCA